MNIENVIRSICIFFICVLVYYQGNSNKWFADLLESFWLDTIDLFHFRYVMLLVQSMWLIRTTRSCIELMLYIKWFAFLYWMCLEYLASCYEVGFFLIFSDRLCPVIYSTKLSTSDLILWMEWCSILLHNYSCNLRFKSLRISDDISATLYDSHHTIFTWDHSFFDESIIDTIKSGFKNIIELSEW